MNIGRGASNWSQLRKTEQTNILGGGDVTVTAGGVTVLLAPTVTLAVGDMVFVAWTMPILKGVVAGNTLMIVSKSAGTGTVVSAATVAAATMTHPSQPAGSTWQSDGCVLFRCTVGGTLTFELFASSAGSDGTVFDASAEIRVTVIRGQ